MAPPASTYATLQSIYEYFIVLKTKPSNAEEHEQRKTPCPQRIRLP